MHQFGVHQGSLHAFSVDSLGISRGIAHRHSYRGRVLGAQLTTRKLSFCIGKIPLQIYDMQLQIPFASAFASAIEAMKMLGGINFLHRHFCRRKVFASALNFFCDGKIMDSIAFKKIKILQW